MQMESGGAGVTGWRVARGGWRVAGDGWRVMGREVSSDE